MGGLGRLPGGGDIPETKRGIAIGEAKAEGRIKRGTAWR